MLATRVKREINFVDGKRKPVDKKKYTLHPAKAIAGLYSLIAFYSLVSAICLYYAAELISAGINYVPVCAGMVTLYLIFIPVRKTGFEKNIAVTEDLPVFLCSPSTHGLLTTAYLAQLLNNCQPTSSHD